MSRDLVRFRPYVNYRIAVERSISFIQCASLNQKA